MPGSLADPDSCPAPKVPAAPGIRGRQEVRAPPSWAVAGSATASSELTGRTGCCCPPAASAPIGSAASAIGAMASPADGTGSAIAGLNWSATEPPAAEPPATEPPAAEPPLAAGGCPLTSAGAAPAADGSRSRAGSQLDKSAAEGYAAERSARNWVAEGLRLGSRDRLRLISGRRLSGTLSIFGLPCTTR